MNILLNGETLDVADDARVSDLIAQLALAGQRIAIEINAELVPRSTFDAHRLAPGDRVEIIHAVGGG